MVRSSPYVLRRGETYSFRCRLPHDIAIRIGRFDVVRALGTDRAAVARLIAAGLAIQLGRLWDDLRMNDCDAGLRQALDAWLSREIDRAWKRFQRQAPDRSIEQRTMVEGDAENQLICMQEEFRAGDYTRGRDGAREIVATLPKPSTDEGHQFSVLAGKVMEALGEVQEARMHWARGNVSYRPVLPSCASPAIAAAPDTGDVPTLAELAEDYLRHRKAESGTNAKGIAQARSQIALLFQEIDQMTPVTEVTPKVAGSVFHALRGLPPNYRKNRLLEGLSPIQAARRASDIGLAPMHAKTMNNHLTTFRGVFEEAKCRKIIKENPFDDMWFKPKKRPVGNNPREFKEAELEAILGMPVFMGCERAGRPFQPGAYLIEDWRFWLPITALLTGARINELCQLRAKDVVMMKGVLVFHINTEDGKTLKTPESKREVPVHDELIRLGLEAYIASRPASDVIGSLFDIPKPLNGDWGAKAGNWFREKLLVRALPENRRPGIGFHSFRHKVVTDVRDADVREDVSHRLMGHANKNTQATYGGQDIATATKSALMKIKLPAALAHIPPRRSGMPI